MPTYGAYSPQPERYGGGSSLLQTILNSLNRARGSAYSTERGTAVWAENMAAARAIASMFESTERLVNAFDPNKCVDPMLGRWEKFCGLIRLPSDTDVDRRTRFAAHLKRFGQATTYQYFVDQVSAALGSVYVGITLTNINSALIFWPAGTSNTDFPWLSTVAHVLVHVQLPAGYSEGDFQNAVATIQLIADAILPAWATVDWYRNGSYGAGVGSWSADTSAGLYLDELNLDNEVFDV